MEETARWSHDFSQTRFFRNCAHDFFRVTRNFVPIGVVALSLALSFLPHFLSPMLSRNKGIFSPTFLVPVLGFVLSAIVVHTAYALWVRPAARDFAIMSRLKAMNAGDKPQEKERSVYVIVKDPEQELEVVLWVWATILLAVKLRQVGRERKMIDIDFVGARPGERIIPDDALDRFKEITSAVEANPQWQERLLPECILAALHRFHSTSSVQDASGAIKERAELAADNLDSALSLVRYAAWAIPAVGFIGTVRGIGEALEQADRAIKGDISGVTEALGLAFNSTLVALLLSMVLMFMLHLLQERQEKLIMEMQNYCREKLLDIMKVPTRETSDPVLT